MRWIIFPLFFLLCFGISTQIGLAQSGTITTYAGKARPHIKVERLDIGLLAGSAATLVSQCA
jgi:hypothetical protein